MVASLDAPRKFIEHRKRVAHDQLSRSLLVGIELEKQLL